MLQKAYTGGIKCTVYKKRIREGCKRSTCGLDGWVQWMGTRDECKTTTCSRDGGLCIGHRHQCRPTIAANASPRTLATMPVAGISASVPTLAGVSSPALSSANFSEQTPARRSSTRHT